MGLSRAQATSAAVAVLLSLGLLWGAVARLSTNRRGLADRQTVLLERTVELEQTLEAARDVEDELREQLRRKDDLLANVDLARSVAEEQRGAAVRGLYLAHLEGARRALSEGDLAGFDAHAALVPSEHRGWVYRYLRNQRTRKVRELPPHPEDVGAMASTETHLVTGSRGGLVRVYAIGDFDATLVLELALEEEISALAFDSTGEHLAVGTDAGSARVLRLDSREELRLHTFEERVCALAFEPQGTGMLVGLFEGGIWHAPEGETPRALAAHGSRVNTIAVADDGRTVATGSDDARILLHGGEQWEQARVLEGHTDWVRSLAFRDDSNALVSGSDDRSLRVWDVSTGVERGREAFADSIVSTRFGPAGDVLFVGADGQLSGGTLPVPVDAFLEQATIAPGGEWIASTQGEGRVHLWFAGAPAKRVLELGASPRQLAVGDAGRILVAGCLGGRVLVLDATGGTRLHEWKLDEAAAPAVALNASGTHVAAGGRDGVRVWDLASGTEVGRFLPDANRVHSVALSADAGVVAAASNEGPQWTWALATGELQHESPPAQGFLFLARLDRRAERLAWVGDAGTIRSWSTRDGQRLAALRDRSLGRVDALDLSLDGTRLALVSNDHEVASFDLARAEPLGRARRPQTSFRAVALGPDGERFATGSLEGTVSVWDTQSAAFLLSLIDLGPRVSDLVFSADGTVLAVAHDAGITLFEVGP